MFNKDSRDPWAEIPCSVLLCFRFYVTDTEDEISTKRSNDVFEVLLGGQSSMYSMRLNKRFNIGYHCLPLKLN